MVQPFHDTLFDVDYFGKTSVSQVEFLRTGVGREVSTFTLSVWIVLFWLLGYAPPSVSPVALGRFECRAHVIKQETIF